jgi:ArsR family transcriptional regulator
MQDKFEVIKLLSDRTRFQILTHLLDFDQLCVSELEQLLGTKQANTSRHLKKLKEAGVLTSHRVTHSIYYRIDPSFLREHEVLLRYLLA